MKYLDILQKIEKSAKIIDSKFSNAQQPEIIKSIRKQLDFIKNDLEKSAPSNLKENKADVQRIILGVQAVREIESQNEELADLLCDIDYEYKKLYGIS